MFVLNRFNRTDINANVRLNAPIPEADGKPRRRYRSFRNPELAREAHEIIELLHPTSIQTKQELIPDSERTIYLALSEMQIEFRRLVGLWLKCKRNLQKLFKKEPTLQQRSRYGRTELYVGRDGKGYLEWAPVTPEAHLRNEAIDYASPEDNALRHFINLIISPGADMLSGPCRRCGKYFLRENEHKRTYCSRICSSNTTSNESVRRTRSRQRVAKIKKAEALILEWRRTSPRMDCVSWILRDPDFKRNWLTRAAKSREIEIPQRAKDPASNS